jgi:curved DNA-binding protein CbpA
MSSELGRNFYDLLGLKRDASDEDVKRQFRVMVKQWHPDATTAPNADAMFKQINEAYLVLSDASQRRQYDLELAAQERKSRPRDLIDQVMNRYSDYEDTPGVDDDDEVEIVIRRKKKKSKQKVQQKQHFTRKGDPDIGDIPDGYADDDLGGILKS